jgi:hypothetical protein
MNGFPEKRIELSHDLDRAVRFVIEIAPTVQHDVWQRWHEVEVAAGETAVYAFPEGFSAHWARATALFVYTGLYR